MQGNQLTLSPKQFQAIRKRLGVTVYALRRITGVSLGQLYRYDHGTAQITGPFARLLILLDRHGIPEEWYPGRMTRNRP